MRDHLIRELETAYTEFLAALEGLGERDFERKWLDGKWGAREIAAHIAGWLGQLGAGLERMSRGEEPSGSHDWSDVNAWNETFAKHAKGKRRHEVMHELGHAVAGFKKRRSLCQRIATEKERRSTGCSMPPVSHTSENTP